MDKEQLGKDIIELLHSSTNNPMTAAEISRALKLQGQAAKKIQKWLNQLVVAGQIVRIRHDRFAIGEPADLVTGVLDLARSGNGFLTETGGPDIVLPATGLGTAMPGDRVVVRLDAVTPDPTEKRRSGAIIRILERARHDIVGTLKSTGKFFYVVPIDPSYKQDFYVPDAKGAKINDRVVVRFTNWQNKHVSPEAEVTEVLGPADKPSLDTISIIRHFGFKDEFPPAVLREVEKASSQMDNPGPRLDLRNKWILTIDPVTARDFDDALSLEVDRAGHRVLGVHIADVAHFVRKGSATDLEARERGNSVYLGDKVIPMFPEQLSNGICSLRPNEDRFTCSVFMTIDESGRILNRSFARTIIRSKLRLTYQQAFAALKGSNAKPLRDEKSSGEPVVIPNEALKVLRDLHDLAQQFRAKRFAQYALELDVPECEILIGPDGGMTGIQIVENDISHQLVEECMVAANEAVSTELNNRGLASIFRIHQPPKKEKIESLTAELMDMGLKPGDLSNRKNLAAFLTSVKNSPLAYHIRVAVLRSMNRAIYSEKPEGHYGLSKKYYGHFTSPIRRYPDLVLHRQLAYLISSGRMTPAKSHEGLGPQGATERPMPAGGEKVPYDTAEVAAVSVASSSTESNADRAERALLEIKKYRYLATNMQGKKPKTYDAVVVSVMNFGMFVELLDLQLQGLVHVSGVSEKFVTFNRKRRALEAGKLVYKLGTKIKVAVRDIDFDKRKIDFKMVHEEQVGGSKQENRGRRSDGRR